MQRRKFCHGIVATGAVSLLPGCSRDPAEADRHAIAAVTGDGTQTSIETAAVSELAGELEGRVYMSGDDGYDTVKRVWNGMFDHKSPALIAQCRSTTDVVKAVRFARERNLLVAVRGGGHSLPGKSTCDGGLVIDLSPMHATSLDANARTLRVHGGALLGHIDGATHPHNLATTTGIVSHTGAGGFTLGGGYGRTDRSTGLAVDNLLAATMVTANGDVVRASPDADAELYWAIRGGGGNFGVATEFLYRLHDFDPVVYGGTVTFDLTEDLLNRYGELAAELPNEANIEPNISVAADGRRIVVVEVVWAGDKSEGERELRSVTKLAKPLETKLGPFDYGTMQTAADTFLGHGRQYYLKSALLGGMTPDVSKAIVEHMKRDNPPLSWFQHLGGVQLGVAPDAMAYPHRDAMLNLGVMVISDDPSTMEANIESARAFYRDIEPYRVGFYMNLNEDTDARTISNFGANYDRLVAAKDRYDPGNLFRLNANIRPSA